MTIQEEIKKVNDEMEAILTKAEAEKRNLSDDEQCRWDGLDIRLRGLQASANQTRRTIPIPRPINGETHSEVPCYGVRGGLADWRKLFCRSNASQNDAQTPEQYLIERAEGRGMAISSGDTGGWAANDTLSANTLQIVNTVAQFVPLVTVFPMKGTGVHHISLWSSQDQTSGYFGGISCDWKAEAASFTAKTPKLDIAILQKHKCGLYVNVSREVAEDAGSLVADLGPRMANAISNTFDEKILNGSGVAEPEGIINSNAAVTYARAAANSIDYDDITGMLARLFPQFLKNAVWVAHPSTIPFLANAHDAGDHNLWVQSASASMPQTIFGRPLIFSDKSPTIGKRGDLVLADFSMYAFGVGPDVVVEKSNSPEWYSDQISLRAILRADGRSLISGPITPRSGGATMSPFVVLE